MQQEPDEGLPVGIRPAPGKMRRPPDPKRIAERVARLGALPPVVRAGLIGAKEVVQPLNPGFFHLEHLRQANAVKKRSHKRAKVRGK